MEITDKNTWQLSIPALPKTVIWPWAPKFSHQSNELTLAYKVCFFKTELILADIICGC